MSHSKEDQPAADIATAFRARVGEAMLEHAHEIIQGKVSTKGMRPKQGGRTRALP